MGATDEQPIDEVEDNEKPAHQVTLSNYYIGKHEVTQKQWYDVMGTWPNDGIYVYIPTDGSRGDDYPIYTILWDDAQAFITKLNEKTGLTYRLPTEAEWEYAARGGKKSKHYVYCGGNVIDDVAWYTANSDEHTHPIGTTALANELGLYDMSGNVYEWSSDWYGPYESDAQTNPTGATTGTTRVLRGGSWFNEATRCRVTLRGSSALMDTHYSNVGFRLVLEDVNVK
jgi:formylglycine-generating enzyme required for sulfatase activity